MKRRDSQGREGRQEVGAIGTGGQKKKQKNKRKKGNTWGKNRMRRKGRTREGNKLKEEERRKGAKLDIKAR